MCIFIVLFNISFSSIRDKLLGSSCSFKSRKAILKCKIYVHRGEQRIMRMLLVTCFQSFTLGGSDTTIRIVPKSWGPTMVISSRETAYKFDMIIFRYNWTQKLRFYKCKINSFHLNFRIDIIKRS